MARDQQRLTSRNQKIVADYNRLKAQECPIKVGAHKAFIKLRYEQVIAVLSTVHYLSPRTVESIVSEQNKMTLSELSDGYGK